MLRLALSCTLKISGSHHAGEILNGGSFERGVTGPQEEFCLDAKPSAPKWNRMGLCLGLRSDLGYNKRHKLDSDWFVTERNRAYCGVRLEAVAAAAEEPHAC